MRYTLQRHRFGIAAIIMMLLALMLGQSLMTRIRDVTPKPVVTVTWVLPAPVTTATPPPTAMPKNIQQAKARNDYPELAERVDGSLDTLKIDLLDVTRNASNDGWVFHWAFRHFTPPVLTSITGSEVDAPNTLPYQIILSFNVHTVGKDPSEGVYKFGVTNETVEILDTELPLGEAFEWSMRALYHSHVYSQETAWMDWKPFIPS